VDHPFAITNTDAFLRRVWPRSSIFELVATPRAPARTQISWPGRSTNSSKSTLQIHLPQIFLPCELYGSYETVIDFD